MYRFCCLRLAKCLCGFELMHKPYAILDSCHEINQQTSDINCNSIIKPCQTQLKVIKPLAHEQLSALSCTKGKSSSSNSSSSDMHTVTFRTRTKRAVAATLVTRKLFMKSAASSEGDCATHQQPPCMLQALLSLISLQNVAWPQ